MDYKDPKFDTNADTFRLSNIDSAHRLGKFKKGAQPRNIVVSFVRMNDRKLILQAKNTVKMGTDITFYINEDMSLDTHNLQFAMQRNYVPQLRKQSGMRGLHIYTITFVKIVTILESFGLN